MKINNLLKTGIINSAILLMTVAAQAQDCNPHFNFAQSTLNPYLIKFSPEIETDDLTDYSSFTWDFGDGSGITTGVSPTHTFASTGTYTVCHTSTTTEGVSCTICIDICVNLPYTSSTTDAHVPIILGMYPNPANNQLFVEFHVANPPSNSNYSINIINTLGQTISESTEKISIGNNKKSFQIVDWPAGIYHVSIILGNETSTATFIKE